MMNNINSVVTVTALILTAGWGTTEGDVLTLQGVTVTPHVQSRDMRYRKDTDFSLGGRTQIFVQNTSLSPVFLKPDTDIRLRGRTPKALLEADEWAWYDFRRPGKIRSRWRLKPSRCGPGTASVLNGVRAAVPTCVLG